MIGGPQGPKALLDSVLVATRNGDLAALRDLKQAFVSTEENVRKCVDEAGNTLTHLALGKDSATLQFVVDELKADVNATNLLGHSALHEAVRNNYLSCCELLLRRGANQSVSSATLSTPFHTAAACGSVECMKLLVDNSSNKTAAVNEADRNKCTALHKCAYDGDVRVTKWLIDNGAVVDAKDIHDTTPLIVATKMGREDVVSLLLENGANANQKDSHGNRCVHYCASRCLPKILRRLIGAEATVNVQNDEFNNPLHLAAMNQRADSFEWETLVIDLIRNGCDLRQENASGKIPEAYVGRSLKSLFTKDEVRRRQEADKLRERTVAEKKRADDEERLQLVIEARAAQQAKEQRLREEEERRHREAEERHRAEDDARQRVEEAAEQRRIEEEELRKAKAKAAKGK